MMILLLLQFAFSSVQVCEFQPTLESWLSSINLPSTIDNCSYQADEYNYLNGLELGLRGKHILNRRADYDVWVKTEEKKGEVGVRLTFYYFKKSDVETKDKAKQIGNDIEAFAKTSGLQVEKVVSEEKVKSDLKSSSVEWQGLLKFRLKPSRSTPDTRYKIQDLDIGLKFRLNRLEFYAILKTPVNNPLFDIAKTYASSSVHMLSKGHFPDFSGPSFAVPQSTEKSLSYDSTLGLPGMIKMVHQQLEAI
ncbi:MAG: hypothetical protein KDD37_09965 [Bdellovibrionales bacterium]|nr:hypothetical protein [Bdellovibrionales bacterium]